MQEPLVMQTRSETGSFPPRIVTWSHSFDEHETLMGYQNSTFPLAIYGCIDTTSRKILWLKIWASNSDPQLIGHWYLEYVFESKVIASFMRLVKGTETGTIVTMHAGVANLRVKPRPRLNRGQTTPVFHTVMN